jgi:transposase
MGQLANRAQHKARGIIAALFAAKKATGNKINVPEVKQVGCPAKIAHSSNSFDFWVTVENLFRKSGGVELPVKAHRKFNEAVRLGWKLNPVCELFKDRNGKFYARVFVQKEAPKEEGGDVLGCDVGYRNAVSRSDGYMGKNTAKVIKLSRLRDAERRRQGIVKRGFKSFMKQTLDLEAKRTVARCKRSSLSLAYESPKTLANLKSGKLHGWARSYFAKRCQTLCAENGVRSVWVNPAFTSLTCAECGLSDRQSRHGISFVCVGCGHSAHADINAARNIAAKGTAYFSGAAS